MRRVWRLCQAAQQATAFSGDGARRYGGRWNPKGLSAVYTAVTQSLAALEILVHVDTDLVPNDFVLFAVDIPDNAIISSIHSIPISRCSSFIPQCRSCSIGGSGGERDLISVIPTLMHRNQ